MSLLTATVEDVQPRGALLPEGVYRITVEEAKPETFKGKGSQLMRRYGNIRTKDGATEIQNGEGTFRIGNRKLFARSWIDHTNPRAAQAGRGQIIREAIASGLMQKPEKGVSSELPFGSWEEYAGELVGREFLVQVRHRDRKNSDGTVQRSLDGEAMRDVEVVDYLAP